LQRTFPRNTFEARLRTVRRGEQVDPLDLVEWLEDQGYEPEAQVSHKGEIALRGGILDLFPLTSPWPVRLEFFGDEIESLRYFDPLTQISREEIESATIPPAGELGLLKRQLAVDKSNLDQGEPATLLEYLPAHTIFLNCEPERLRAQAEAYQQQVPEGDPLLVDWDTFQRDAAHKGMTILQVNEAPADVSEFSIDELEAGPTQKEPNSWDLRSLEAFRPLAERAPEPQVAQAQRKDFFAQIHRWLRQNYEVHLFCNNDGERQRFMEIWEEYGLASPTTTDNESAPGPSGLSVHLGSWPVDSSAIRQR
jgi:transcription-repair coupling factor (superfamily II helicase)